MTNLTLVCLAGGSLNMRNITLAIREVVEWYGLGIALNIDRHKLDEIRINRQNNPQHCKVSLQYNVCSIQHLPSDNMLA